jgi:hypothetical protein
MNEAGEQILLHRIKSLEWLLDVKTEQVYRLETALKQIKECDWPGSEPGIYSRADWMQKIAREALE